MKKVFPVIIVLLVLMMVSCVNQPEKVQTEPSQPVELVLSQIEGQYTVEDYTDLGVWILSVESQVLEAVFPVSDVYTFTTGQRAYSLKRNPLRRDQYFVLLSEDLTLETISSAVISLQDTQGLFTGRADGEIIIESVYVQKAAAVNGTNLYILTMEDYAAMKLAKNDFIYENGKLLRPVCVKSSDGYVYEMQRYYNARQAAASHTVDGAFEFLKHLPNPETYLFEGEPNRVGISQSGEITTLPPDTRDRVRDLGSMGDIQTSAYDIVDGDASMTLYVNRNEIDASYQSAEIFNTEINGTIYKLTETETAGIFSVIVPHTETTNVDLVKNARFAIGTPFDSGDGTQGNPFGIATADQLNAIRGKYLDTPGNGYYFRQIADIDMSVTDYATNWTPIGTETTPFCGSYDGQNFKISNLVIEASDRNDNGLFGVTYAATLSNISLEEASVTGFEHSAILVGHVQFGEIDHCSTTGKLIVSYRSGGLCGQASTATIMNSSASVTIDSDRRGHKGGFVGCTEWSTITYSQAKSIISKEPSGHNGTGGFVGQSQYNSYIANCHADTFIYLNGNEIGGFIGGNYGGTIVESCTASATIQIDPSNSYDHTNTGGFAGSNTSVIRKCSSSGSVSGFSAVGGFVGINNQMITTEYGKIDRCYTTAEVYGQGKHVGGFAGIALKGDFMEVLVGNALISNCYSLGDVTGGENTGGFVGSVESDSVENCYAAGSVTSESEYAGGFSAREINLSLENTSDAVTLQNCYWDISTTGYTDSLGLIGGFGKLTPDMKQKSTFADWVFDSAEPVWTIVEGGGEYSYPYLVDNSPETEPGRTTISVFNGGSGTPEDPYEIASWEQLSKLNEAEYRDKHFKLVTNMTENSYGYSDYAAVNDNTGWDGWTPIGDTENPFTGSFNGNGYKIKDLTIENHNKEYQGLFGCVENATLSNCVVENAGIIGKSVVGILAAKNNGSVIIDCSTTGKLADGYTMTGINLGGLVGINNGTVTNCRSDAEVGEGEENCLGGLIGENQGWIISSSSTGTVSGNQNIGGLVGTNSGIIRFSFSSAEVSGTSYVGGFAGYNEENPGEISQCYSVGAVKNNDTSLTTAGGFVGCLSSGTIQNCYSTSGFVLEEGISTLSLGGFVGDQNNGRINHCYSTGYELKFCGIGWSTMNKENHWQTDSTRTGIESISGGKSLSPEFEREMKERDTYVDWDFTDIWDIYNLSGNCSYPYLRTAQQEPLPGYGPEKDFGAGDGSEENPFIVYSKETLRNIGKGDYVDKGYRFKLINDITLQDEVYNDFLSIGTANVPFTGIFDGQGNTICKLRYHSADDDYAGLFGVVETATITDVRMQAPVVDTAAITGSIAGWLKSGGVVENCHVTGNNEDSISEVSDVTYGGLVGKNQGCIKKSSFKSAEGEEYRNSIVGGLVAINEGTIDTCYADVDFEIKYDNSYLAGLIAKQNGGTVVNSYAGGLLCGETLDNNAYDHGYIGGLIAEMTGGTVENCYSYNNIIQEDDKTGGLIATKSGGTASGYWDFYYYPGSSAAGTGLSSEASTKQSSYSGWDFTDVWAIDEGDSMPYLLDNIPVHKPVNGTEFPRIVSMETDSFGETIYVTCSMKMRPITAGALDSFSFKVNGNPIDIVNLGRTKDTTTYYFSVYDLGQGVKIQSGQTVTMSFIHGSVGALYGGNILTDYTDVEVENKVGE